MCKHEICSITACRSLLAHQQSVAHSCRCLEAPLNQILVQGKSPEHQSAAKLHWLSLRDEDLPDLREEDGVRRPVRLF